MSEAHKFSWRLFWILFAAAILGIAGAVPAGMELFASVLFSSEPLPLPLPLILVLGAVQNLTLLALFVGVGLRLASKLGLGPELTRAMLNGSVQSHQLRQTVVIGVVAGILLGAVLVPAILVLARYLPNLPFVIAARIAIWKRVLLCLYGGLYEEIFTRLFLLSLFAWLFNKGWKKERRQLSGSAFWIANCVVAVLFGLGHLPGASLVMPITPLVVVAALILNGIAAVVFGWLYRERGLEAAMIAHFTTDFLLYVVGPQFI